MAIELNMDNTFMMSAHRVGGLRNACTVVLYNLKTIVVIGYMSWGKGEGGPRYQHVSRNLFL